MKNWIQKGQKGFEVNSPTLKIIKSFAAPKKKFTPYVPKEKSKTDILDLSEVSTFGEAFRIANKRLGEGNIFTYKGKSYETDLKKEIPKKNISITRDTYNPKLAKSNFSSLEPIKKSYDLVLKPNVEIKDQRSINTLEQIPSPEFTGISNKINLSPITNRTIQESIIPISPIFNKLQSTVSGLSIPTKEWNVPQASSIINDLKSRPKEIEKPSTKEIVTNPIPESKKPILQQIIKQSPLPEDVKTVLSSKTKNKNFETFAGKYYVLSKEDGNIYAFDKNHKLIDSTIAGRGATIGDFPNVGSSKSKNVGKHATTRAGSAVISEEEASSEDINNYGTPFYRIKFNDIWKSSEGLGLHGIYKNEYEFRKSIMDNPKILNKLVSWGCINIDADWLKKPSTKPAVGDSLFITPEPKWNTKFSGHNLYR